MKIVHAPMNFAMQPMLLVEEMRRRGIDAVHVQYINSAKPRGFNFRHDRLVDIRDYPSMQEAQLATLEKYLSDDYDIFHFGTGHFGIGSIMENFPASTFRS